MSKPKGLRFLRLRKCFKKLKKLSKLKRSDDENQNVMNSNINTVTENVQLSTTERKSIDAAVNLESINETLSPESNNNKTENTIEYDAETTTFIHLLDFNTLDLTIIDLKTIDYRVVDFSKIVSRPE